MNILLPKMADLKKKKICMNMKKNEIQEMVKKESGINHAQREV